MTLSIGDLTERAGSGSCDGHQERARRVLDARLTADRAAELYGPDADPPPGPAQRDYLAVVTAYADTIAAAYESAALPP